MLRGGTEPFKKTQEDIYVAGFNNSKPADLFYHEVFLSANRLSTTASNIAEPIIRAQENYAPLALSGLLTQEEIFEVPTNLDVRSRDELTQLFVKTISDLTQLYQEPSHRALAIETVKMLQELQYTFAQTEPVGNGQPYERFKSNMFGPENWMSILSIADQSELDNITRLVSTIVNLLDPNTRRSLRTRGKISEIDARLSTNNHPVYPFQIFDRFLSRMQSIYFESKLYSEHEIINPPPLNEQMFAITSSVSDYQKLVQNMNLPKDIPPERVLEQLSEVQRTYAEHPNIEYEHSQSVSQAISDEQFETFADQNQTELQQSDDPRWKIYFKLTFDERKTFLRSNIDLYTQFKFPMQLRISYSNAIELAKAMEDPEHSAINEKTPDVYAELRRKKSDEIQAIVSVMNDRPLTALCNLIDRSSGEKIFDWVPVNLQIPLLRASIDSTADQSLKSERIRYLNLLTKQFADTTQQSDDMQNTEAILAYLKQVDPQLHRYCKENNIDSLEELYGLLNKVTISLFDLLEPPKKLNFIRSIVNESMRNQIADSIKSFSMVEQWAQLIRAGEVVSKYVHVADNSSKSEYQINLGELALAFRISDKLGWGVADTDMQAIQLIEKLRNRVAPHCPQSRFDYMNTAITSLFTNLGLHPNASPAQLIQDITTPRALLQIGLENAFKIAHLNRNIKLPTIELLNRINEQLGTTLSSKVISELTDLIEVDQISIDELITKLNELPTDRITPTTKEVYAKLLLMALTKGTKVAEDYIDRTEQLFSDRTVHQQRNLPDPLSRHSSALRNIFTSKFTFNKVGITTMRNYPTRKDRMQTLGQELSHLPYEEKLNALETQYKFLTDARVVEALKGSTNPITGDSEYPFPKRGGYIVSGAKGSGKSNSIESLIKYPNFIPIIDDVSGLVPEGYHGRSISSVIFENILYVSAVTELRLRYPELSMNIIKKEALTLMTTWRSTLNPAQIQVKVMNGLNTHLRPVVAFDESARLLKNDVDESQESKFRAAAATGYNNMLSGGDLTVVPEGFHTPITIPSPTQSCTMVFIMTDSHLQDLYQRASNTNLLEEDIIVDPKQLSVVEILKAPDLGDRLEHYSLPPRNTEDTYRIFTGKSLPAVANAISILNGGVPVRITSEGVNTAWDMIQALTPAGSVRFQIHQGPFRLISGVDMATGLAPRGEIPFLDNGVLVLDKDSVTQILSEKTVKGSIPNNPIPPTYINPQHHTQRLDLPKNRPQSNNNLDDW